MAVFANVKKKSRKIILKKKALPVEKIENGSLKKEKGFHTNA